jgi:S-adenosylmethionine:tRNA ribosyltransferase-isomerase
MEIEALDYHLPRDLIAERPVEPRESSRLMVVHRKTKQIEHRTFKDVSSYFNQDDLLVLNSARVSPARLFVFFQNRREKLIEILVLDSNDSARCRAMIYPSREINPGGYLVTATSKLIIRVRNEVDGVWQLELEDRKLNWRSLLESEGQMPLPPYILKQRATKQEVPEDRVWYQTVYADQEGAVAAPTAGLHFSKEVLSSIESSGAGIAKILLKVGIGTFTPIRTNTVEEHVLLPEEYEVTSEAAQKIQSYRKPGGRIIAVGTTSVRTLEYCASKGSIVAGKGTTNLLITPSHEFRIVQGLITNFHLPKTTLLALVYSFAGRDLIRSAYEEAIRRRYRFFSYGDAMLIL